MAVQAAVDRGKMLSRRYLLAALSMHVGLTLGCAETPSRGHTPDGPAAQDGTSGADAPAADGLSTAPDSRPATGDGADPGVGLSSKYPDDVNIGSDPAVLFHDDFEQGWGKWDSPSTDTKYLHIESNASLANGGSKYLRSTVTKSDLDVQQYISSAAKVAFAKRVDTVFWRFHVRFKGIAPNPHHWVRVSAGDASYDSSGLANTVPSGDKGFWFDFDINNNDQFNFYVYWYKMRSGRCNDGTAIPGCAGDQGTTYYYGNTFRPPNQAPFTRDKWICVEMRGKTNTLGSSDGELAFWIDGQLVDEYKPGHPIGTWLRDAFHTGGCSYSACTAPQPFEGFDFRSSTEVRFKHIVLDAYYQRDTFANKKAALEALGLKVSNEQTIYYDDVVAATERIGCKVGK